MARYFAVEGEFGRYSDLVSGSDKSGKDIADGSLTVLAYYSIRYKDSVSHAA
jgi:hypothetical protein